MESTILVTGGAGFIGSCFARQQIASGKRVVVLDALTYAGHLENLEGIKSEGLIFVKGDIRDGALVTKLLKEYDVDAVVDFAAEPHVDNSISSPSAFIETNVLGCYALLESSRVWYNSLSGGVKEKFRFVHVSTDEVYGSLGDSGKFTEESPMRPNSPYSASKAAGDHLCRAWFHTYGFPVIVTNCTNNYGERQFPEKFIPRIITTALAGEKIPIYGDGKNIRDWIHVADHSVGVALALEKGRVGETYAFGGDAERNNIQVAQTICNIIDDIQPRSDGISYSGQMSFVPDRAGHDRRYAVDDTKAQHELGFPRRYQFEDGLRETVRWYLENRNWCAAVTKKI